MRKWRFSHFNSHDSRNCAAQRLETDSSYWTSRSTLSGRCDACVAAAGVSVPTGRRSWTVQSRPLMILTPGAPAGLRRWGNPTGVANAGGKKRAAAIPAMLDDGRARGSRRDAPIRRDHRVYFRGDAGQLVNAHRPISPPLAGQNGADQKASLNTPAPEGRGGVRLKAGSVRSSADFTPRTSRSSNGRSSALSSSLLQPKRR